MSNPNQPRPRAQESENEPDPPKTGAITRRDAIRASAAAAAAAVALPAAEAIEGGEPAVTKGRIRQSIMGWTFNPMPTPELARHCKAIGLVAMEGISPQHYPLVKELGMEISLVGSHGFKEGPLNPEFHPKVEAKLREGIDRAVEFKAERVITFTGMRKEGITDARAFENCLDCWKKVLPYAEEKGITLCLEHLNSRDDSHPMKGHPGYFGDDVELCVDLVKKVGSPHFKLLFDCYHVQVMNGDIIRRIRKYHELIGHYHTAGNPGRGELDDKQEINYPPIMRAIVETGYKGFVAQEFIPTWENPVAALRHAAKLCDV